MQGTKITPAQNSALLTVRIMLENILNHPGAARAARIRWINLLEFSYTDADVLGSDFAGRLRFSARDALASNVDTNSEAVELLTYMNQEL